MLLIVQYYGQGQVDMSNRGPGLIWTSAEDSREPRLWTERTAPELNAQNKPRVSMTLKNGVALNNGVVDQLLKGRGDSR